MNDKVLSFEDIADQLQSGAEDPLIQDIRETINLFKKAEVQIKDGELFSGDGIYIPAINELRYAGRHLLDAMDQVSPERRKDEIHRAQKHCKRALYDASEACLLDAYERYDSLLTENSSLDLREHVHNIEEIRHVASRIKEKVRTRATDERKEQYYKDLVELHTEFSALLEDFESKRFDLSRARRHQIITYRGLTLGIVATLFGALATLVSPFLSSYANTLFKDEANTVAINEWAATCITQKMNDSLRVEQAAVACRNEIMSAFAIQPAPPVGEGTVTEASKP